MVTLLPDAGSVAFGEEAHQRVPQVVMRLIVSAGGLDDLFALAVR
jgi:hypothetical protein